MNRLAFIKTAIFIGILVFITGYAYSKTIDVIRGPEIVVESPTIGATLEKNLIEVKGRAFHIAKLYLNGNQIFTDDEGNFSELLLLPKGYSTLHLEATDIFNRKTVQDIPVAR